MKSENPAFIFLGVPAFVAICHTCVWFLIAVALKRNDVADVAWGLGIILMTWAAVDCAGFAPDRALLAAILVAIWGFRLSIHNGLRNARKGEDFRYRAWREGWGRWFFVRSFLQVFVLQGALAVVITSPVTLIAAYRGGPLNGVDLLGLVVWLVGFLFETVGDWQLVRFKANPANRGKIMATGLWRYTRHPNYFGEVTQWWGLWILALSVPNGWMSFVGPLTISLLILKVSGVPILEEKLRRDINFREYAYSTSAFIPWVKKKSVSRSSSCGQ